MYDGLVRVLLVHPSPMCLGSVGLVDVEVDEEEHEVVLDARGDAELEECGDRVGKGMSAGGRVVVVGQFTRGEGLRILPGGERGVARVDHGDSQPLPALIRHSLRGDLEAWQTRGKGCGRYERTG